MLTLNMQNMKARNMEELSENLKEVADSITDGCLSQSLLKATSKKDLKKEKFSIITI